MMKTIFSVAGLAIAGAAFILFTQPNYDTAKALEAQIAEYNQALDKAAELQQLKQSLLSRYNAFNTGDLDRLHKLLPDHVDNVRLILDLDSLASHYGLALQNVDVSSSEAVAAKSQTAIGAIGAGNQKYDSLTLKFSTTGTYGNFLQFLADLESSLRIVDLASLSIASAGGESVRTTGGVEPLYTYTIALRTYWL